MNGHRLLSKESFLPMTKTVTPPQISNGYNNGFGYAYLMFNLEALRLMEPGRHKAFSVSLVTTTRISGLTKRTEFMNSS